ncbi:MAG: zinc ribbon domain-containing protein [Dehalococcoidia bacterium]|nr:MAG: zinc ribbon domain-containing protein [Dehalococcoidia bacterium]
MPLYEYSCNKCDHIFEKFKETGSSAASVVCPKYGVKNSKRIYSIFNSLSQNYIPRFSGG